MTNAEIAEHFGTLSKLMDLHGENSFKAKSYASAAFAISKLPQPLASMDKATLYQTRGIGQSTGEKVQELLETGHLQALEQLLEKTPEGLLQLLQIKGLGPKKIAAIWKELGIESLGELAYACEENRLADLKGFGLKTQQSVAESIRFMQQSEGFHLWSAVEAAALRLIAALNQHYPGSRTETTGSLRRQDEVLPLAELVTTLSAAELSTFFSDAEALANEAEETLLIRMPAGPDVLFYLSSADGFERRRFLSTGSEDFLRTFEKKHSLPAADANEAAIFEAAGLQYIPAPLREGSAVLQLAAEGALQELVRAEDICGIIHSHSTWSDGRHSIEEMAEAAREQGFEYLVISDHSQAAFYAKGLSPESVRQQQAEIDALNARLAPFRIFKSTEADILGDGRLDYDEALLRSFDLVIASVHSNLKMPLEKAMDRLLTAIANPFTNILGHPTGRLLLSRRGYPVDHRKIIDACAEHQVVIEINAHPRRLDIDWRWIGYARERGVLLSIDPDAHSIAGFGDVRYGAMIAQKGGLLPAQNLSSFSLAEFELFVRQQQAKRP